MTAASPNAVPLVTLRNSLGEVINRVTYTHERATISKNGKTVAAIVPIEDLELLEQLELQADSAALEEARAEDTGERISLESFRAGERP